MHSERQKYLCPVCGYTELDEAPYDEFKCASYGICPCCGTQFGNDDSSKSHEDLRQQWILSGMQWWSKNKQSPKDWHPKTQLGIFRSV